jgi:predicted amidohydrolase
MDNPSVVRICSAQISSIWEEPEKTLEKADIHGSIVSSLQAYAKAYRITILGSFRQVNDPLPKNSAVVIGRDGTILSTYAKMHLFSHGHEDEGNSPGTDLGMFTLDSLTCGIAICYDLRFPDLFRLYAKNGVQAVFIPSAWPQIRTRHWELFIQARALENQMYVIGVNITGQTPIEFYSGNSMTADPQGIIISRANDAEQLVFTDLDPAIVAETRHRFPVEKDRRDALYRSLSPDNRGS